MSSSSQLTFGPPDSQWIYDRVSRTYDLSRRDLDGSSPPQASQSIALTQGPADTSIVIAPAATALVVIDMQNFFLHPSCRAHPTGLEAVEPLLKTIAHCRRTGVQVIWLNWGLTEDDLAKMPAGVLRGFAKAVIAAGDASGNEANKNEEEEKVIQSLPAVVAKSGLGVDLGDGKGRCLVAGEWNTQLYEPLADVVDDGKDIHCAKNRMSGLWCEAQPLWEHLTTRSTKTTTLLFAGVNTDQCVLGTLTDAYNAGWDCVLVEDCCATTTKGAKEVCSANVGNNYGFVIDSRTFTAA
ncbi:Isochorismatase-like protein [Coniella lustricola]|uniref:Isochorismatase-like protein n=1 Tax=Coniella lustricola TaxID=2025994 RepID=A0A2T3AFG4_9PEZI|nr:Isochorismatase-like protein [Coniella lustricola]